MQNFELSRRSESSSSKFSTPFIPISVREVDVKVLVVKDLDVKFLDVEVLVAEVKDPTAVHLPFARD